MQTCIFTHELFEIFHTLHSMLILAINWHWAVGQKTPTTISSRSSGSCNQIICVKKTFRYGLEKIQISVQVCNYNWKGKAAKVHEL